MDPVARFIDAAADLVEERVRRQVVDATLSERARCARLARDCFRDGDNATARTAGDVIARLIEGT